jgi:L-histidine N-alpha-methyltransferase
MAGGDGQVNPAAHSIPSAVNSVGNLAARLDSSNILLNFPGRLKQTGSCMVRIADVRIHASQFPENVRHELLRSLQTRAVNHKFHYDSVKQAQKWLALHQAYSPARTDPDCAVAYDRSFQAACSACTLASNIHLIGLGCGGGQKETRLLQMLALEDRPVACTLCDVSTALVLTANQLALAILPPERCSLLVCDLLLADDLADLLNRSEIPETTRLITFFGMIPNFEPQIILSRLASVLRPADKLLFSANLAPGPEYLSGIQKVLPLYDNELTRDWLMTFLLDLGVERSDGVLRFVIEDGAAGTNLKKIAAHFQFEQTRRIDVGEDHFQFQAGESIRLFFSYRHTPDQVHALLKAHGIAVLEQWVTRSGEEGVFLCQRT